MKFTSQVLDANEATPAFGAASYTVTNLDENTAIGTALTITPAITATDTDPGDTLTFTLQGQYQE